MTPEESSLFWSLAVQIIVALSLASLIGWLIGDGD